MLFLVSLWTVQVVLNFEVVLFLSSIFSSTVSKISGKKLPLSSLSNLEVPLYIKLRKEVFQFDCQIFFTIV